MSALFVQVHGEEQEENHDRVGIAVKARHQEKRRRDGKHEQSPAHRSFLKTRTEELAEHPHAPGVCTNAGKPEPKLKRQAGSVGKPPHDAKDVNHGRRMIEIPGVAINEGTKKATSGNELFIAIDVVRAIGRQREEKLEGEGYGGGRNDGNDPRSWEHYRFGIRVRERASSLCQVCA